MFEKKTLVSMTIILVTIELVLLIFILWLGRGWYMDYILLPKAPEKEEIVEETIEEEIVTEPTAEPTKPPVQPNAEFFAKLASLHEENPDMWGWIAIDHTVVDYPVMYTPEDAEKYLRLDFKGVYSVAGLPFLDVSCSVDPESMNLMIYGHNMKDGSMFREIMAYKDKSQWEEHPVIRLFTLQEEREYEVLAAFYDRVYYKDEDCFKFYQFINPQNEAEYNEGINYFKEHSQYDTGVTAEYGDRLLTLVTCSYHTDNGRFVVVAKEVTNDAEQ